MVSLHCEELGYNKWTQGWGREKRLKGNTTRFWGHSKYRILLGELWIKIALISMLLSLRRQLARYLSLVDDKSASSSPIDIFGPDNSRERIINTKIKGTASQWSISVYTLFNCFSACAFKIIWWVWISGQSFVPTVSGEIPALLSEL